VIERYTRPEMRRSGTTRTVSGSGSTSRSSPWRRWYARGGSPRTPRACPEKGVLRRRPDQRDREKGQARRHRLPDVRGRAYRRRLPLPSRGDDEFRRSGHRLRRPDASGPCAPDPRGGSGLRCPEDPRPRAPEHRDDRADAWHPRRAGDVRVEDGAVGPTRSAATSPAWSVRAT